MKFTFSATLNQTNLTFSSTKKIVLIIPPKRFKKMNQLLKQSHYIGLPLYLENKLVYSYSDSIAKIYKTLSTKNNLDLQEVLANINRFLISPNISE